MPREYIPPSKLDSSRYAQGPNGMAKQIEHRLKELKAASDACPTKTGQRAIKRHMKELRTLRNWCLTRAGYDPKATGMIDG